MDRVGIVGDSCSGERTVGRGRAGGGGGAQVELDALYWLPGWTEPETTEFRANVEAAISRLERWVVSGNYLEKTQDVVWPLATAIVWLDLPLRVTIPRILRRSWRRWRSRELLWGTNREVFWGQLKVWSDASLIGYTVRHHRRRRAQIIASLSDPRWRAADRVR